MIKFRIKLDQVDYETLIKVLAKDFEDGRLQWNLAGTVLETTRVIYEP